MLTPRSLATETGFTTFPNILMGGIDGSLRVSCETSITRIFVFFSGFINSEFSQHYFDISFKSSSFKSDTALLRLHGENVIRMNK